MDLKANRTTGIRRGGMSTYGIEAPRLSSYGGQRVFSGGRFSGAHDTRLSKKRSEPPFYRFLRELESGELT